MMITCALRMFTLKIIFAHRLGYTLECGTKIEFSLFYYRYLNYDPTPCWVHPERLGGRFHTFFANFIKKCDTFLLIIFMLYCY